MTIKHLGKKDFLQMYTYLSQRKEFEEYKYEEKMWDGEKTTKNFFRYKLPPQ